MSRRLKLVVAVAALLVFGLFAAIAYQRRDIEGRFAPIAAAIDVERTRYGEGGKPGEIYALQVLHVKLARKEVEKLLTPVLEKRGYDRRPDAPFFGNDFVKGKAPNLDVISIMEGRNYRMNGTIVTDSRSVPLLEQPYAHMVQKDIRGDALGSAVDYGKFLSGN